VLSQVRLVGRDPEYGQDPKRDSTYDNHIRIGKEQEFAGTDELLGYLIRYASIHHKHSLKRTTNFCNPEIFQSWERKDLLVILLLVLANDVVEAELVDTLGGGDDTEPVTELLLLEELLCQVLEVATGEVLVGDDLDLAVVEVGDGDALAEVTGKTVNLDAGLEEGGEGRRVEDLVVGGLGSVDDELLRQC
jgi:hypothetical protein